MLVFHITREDLVETRRASETCRLVVREGCDGWLDPCQALCLSSDVTEGEASLQVLELLPQLRTLHWSHRGHLPLLGLQGDLLQCHTQEIYPGFSLVKLLHYCPLIGLELQSVEIFS